MEYNSEGMDITPPSSPILGYSKLLKRGPPKNVNIQQHEEEAVPCFQCRGPLKSYDDPSFSPEGLLLQGVIPSTLKTLEEVDKLQSEFLLHNMSIDVDPFAQNRKSCAKFFGGRIFDPLGSKGQLQTLIKMTRKNLQSLEILSQPSFLPFLRKPSNHNLINPIIDEKWDPWTLRSEVCHFISYILTNLTKFRKIYSYEEMEELFGGFRRSLVRVEGWSDALKGHVGSSGGNQCSAPPYHLFHLHLELRWTFLILFEVTPPLITWIFEELVALSYFLFHFNAPNESLIEKSPFNCSCVKELWTLLRILLTQLKGKEEFLEKLISCLKDIDKSDESLFSLWLLSNLAGLSRVEPDGSLTTEISEEIGEYPFISSSLKREMATPGFDKRITEVTELITRFVPYWGYDYDLILQFWGFWLANIDRGFANNANYKMYSSAVNWFNLISRISSGQRLHNESDPWLGFLRFLSSSAMRIPKGKDWVKLKSAINLKLTRKNVSEFSETGLIRVSSLYFVLESVRDEKLDPSPIVGRLNEILGFVPPQKSSTTLRALCTMTLLLEKKCLDLPGASECLYKLILSCKSCQNEKLVRDIVSEVSNLWAALDKDRIYSKGDSKRLVRVILDSWIGPPTEWKGIPETLVSALAPHLLKILSNIMALDWSKDIYLKRKLKELLAFATIRYTPDRTTVSNKHPGFNIFEYLTNTLLQSDLTSILVDLHSYLRLKEHRETATNFLYFLSGFLAKAPSNHLIALTFLPLTLNLYLTSNDPWLQSNSALSIIYFCTTDSFLKSSELTESRVASAFKEELGKNLGFKTSRVTLLLDKVLSSPKTCRSFLQAQILPILEAEIRSCEVKRGGGADASLRRCLTDFQAKLNRLAI